MKIIVSSQAEKQLKKLPKVKQIIVAAKIRSLGGGVADAGEEALKGFKSIYRIRLGDYRLVYRKTSEELYIILIGHRKDVYKLLERWLG